MKILSWNVSYTNRKISDLLEYAVAQKADIMCFQELPYRFLKELKKIKNYEIIFIEDFINKNHKKSSFLVSMSKVEIGAKKTFKYYNEDAKSLLNKILYKKVWEMTEVHKSLIIEIKNKSRIYSISNVHLACSVDPNSRLSFLEKMINNFNSKTINIIVGDLNIRDGKLFSLLTGFFSNYSLKQYFLDERKIFKQIIKKAQLKNPFSKHHTSVFPWTSIIQWDHILLPSNIKIKKKIISKKSFGSDHKMILLEI